MMQPAVYLAGPISGLSFHGCTDWREFARVRLAARGIRGWSPMRAKEALAKLETISGHGNEYAHMGPFATSKGVMTRDFFDCNRADVVLVNFVGAKTVSIGTVMEIAWAYQKHTPIILATDNDLHNHMMLNEACGFKVATLDEAINVAIAILS
jgi:nucleoside 2-deoxyribosyltransferase